MEDSGQFPRLSERVLTSEDIVFCNRLHESITLALMGDPVETRITYNSPAFRTKQVMERFVALEWDEERDFVEETPLGGERERRYLAIVHMTACHAKLDEGDNIVEEGGGYTEEGEYELPHEAKKASMKVGFRDAVAVDFIDRQTGAHIRMDIHFDHGRGFSGYTSRDGVSRTGDKKAQGLLGAAGFYHDYLVNFSPEAALHILDEMLRKGRVARDTMDDIRRFYDESAENGRVSPTLIQENAAYFRAILEAISPGINDIFSDSKGR